MEMIKAAGLKKYYVTDNYEVHALDGVSLSVEEGEFLAIIGHQEAGRRHYFRSWAAWMNPLQVASGYAATV